MQQNVNKSGLPLQKFRPRGAQRRTDILKPDVLDDETRRRIVRDVMDGGPSQRVNHEGNHPANFRDRVAGGNGDLLGVMAQRLKTLEAQQQAYRMELMEKTEKLAKAEAKYEAEKNKREEVETAMLELYNEKEELERQVEEMHKFLADYGLRWVGDKDDKNNHQQRSKGIASRRPTSSLLSSPGTSIPIGERFELYAGNYSNKTPVISRSPTPTSGRRGNTSIQQDRLSHGVTSKESANVDHPNLPVSIDVLIRHAKILSDYVGTRGVVSTGKYGGIKEREVVRIVVYQDGICVNGGPFRPFGWPLCDAVINDLAEGYYPYEFKDRYPDGFPIEVIDKTSVRCTHVNGTDRKDNIHSLQQMEENDHNPITREEFLKRLPATLITAGGRIVPVRDNIIHMMEGGNKSKGNKNEGNNKNNSQSGDGTVRHISEAEKRIEEEKRKSEVTNDGNDTSTKGALSPKRVKGLVAVLVRFPSGKKVALNLSPDNTIADLRKELKIAYPSFNKSYDIRLSFPAVTYSDDKKTLRELGLLTSCTLMVQPRERTTGA
ncbi:UBX domain [Trypanosoma melophagium]|uniref:UBX domain n=1 Tax=Trypanosoma melophagium TaxID=715481 RepID=UPI00351A9AA1|nr:UBX domain [Trypanosoma melophagium]